MDKTTSGNFNICIGTKQEVLDDLAQQTIALSVTGFQINHAQPDEVAIMYWLNSNGS